KEAPGESRGMAKRATGIGSLIDTDIGSSTEGRLHYRVLFDTVLARIMPKNVMEEFIPDNVRQARESKDADVRSSVPAKGREPISGTDVMKTERGSKLYRTLLILALFLEDSSPAPCIKLAWDPEKAEGK